MKFAYDFHIHTALSPCGDQDMTPNNIVNMCLLKKLDMIAITDHNSCENVEAVMSVAEGTGLLVIPGMEVETSEEIHIVCLFPTLQHALSMQEMVYRSLPPIKNRIDIFGNQQRLNENDEIVGETEQLLVTATNLTIHDIFREVIQKGGIAIPAHIDRPSYSVLSNLGFIPRNLDITFVEVSKKVAKDSPLCQQYESEKYQILQSSDAHYLQDIMERINFMDLENKSIHKVLKNLSRKSK